MILSSVDAPSELAELVLQQLGIARRALESQASQVILFGSRACDVATAQSDWDVLCVGKGGSTRTRQTDVVWIAPEALASEAWLGSELASHVAAYGRWLWGPDDWRHRTRLTSRAADRKFAAARYQLHELKRLWPLLTAGARKRHLVRLRREVQRYELLRNRIAIPPSAHLDRAWAQCAEEDGDPETLLERLMAALMMEAAASGRGAPGDAVPVRERGMVTLDADERHALGLAANDA